MAIRSVLIVAASVATLDASLYTEPDDSVSLLQLQANQPNMGMGMGSSLCSTGLRSGRFCCGGECGKCGGRGCQNRPGGGNSCCTTKITSKGRRCNGARMQNCLLPRRGGGRGMGMGMGMGNGGGDGEEEEGEEPEFPPIDISEPSVVEELALCETSFQLTNVIRSNLGGAGPDGGDEGLLFGEVSEGTNLLVSAETEYTPNMLNPTGGVLRNGARQGFGVINMASGSSVDLTFTLIDASTGAPKADNDFVMTFFDGDHGMGHESRESIAINGMSSYIVDDDSSLDVSEVSDESLAAGLGEGTFTSTLRGTKEDNPISPLSLTSLQAKRTVTAYFQDKSTFDVTLSESGYVNPQGRNIFFAGASSLICSLEAKCSSYECPLNWQLKQDAEFITCSTKPCAVVDNGLCCVEVQVEVEEELEEVEEERTQPRRMGGMGPRRMGMGGR